MSRKSRKTPVHHPASRPEIQAVVPVECEPQKTCSAGGPFVLCGAVSGVLYDSIFKPALVSLDLRHDDEPLRALVESIVTSIVMRASYDDCRRMDNIFQRYLYYRESLHSGTDTEQVQTQTLCNYWRNQTVMTLFRDASLIFDLLFPGAPAEMIREARIPYAQLSRGMKGILCRKVGGPEATYDERETIEVFNFIRGISAPWIGFSPERVFGLLSGHTGDEHVKNEFALLMPEHVTAGRDTIRNALERTMFIDIVAAQHCKLFAEVTQAFENDERLPDGVVSVLQKRVRFDKVYQAAFDAWTSGNTVNKALHRSSRIRVTDMNAVGALYRLLDDASAHGLAVYMFHYGA